MPSYKRYAAPLVLEPTPSRYLAAYLLCLHVTAGLVVLILPWPWFGKLALLSSLLIYLRYAFRVHYWRTARHAILHLLWDAEDDWWLQNRDGQRYRAELRRDSLVTPWLVILLFTGPWRGTRAVLLMRDNLPLDSLRRLRVRLRLTARRRQDGQVTPADS